VRCERPNSESVVSMPTEIIAKSAIATISSTSEKPRRPVTPAVTAPSASTR
jgi:hypothetical protein